MKEGRQLGEGGVLTLCIECQHCLYCNVDASKVIFLKHHLKESEHDEQYCRDKRNRLTYFNHLLPVLGRVHGRFCQQYL